MFPKTGWLADFQRYREQRESPALFNLFSGLTVLGAALRRNVILPYAERGLLPSMYTILVGPPGRSKKTSATSAAVDLLYDAQVTKILPQKTSDVGLLQMLAQDQAVGGINAATGAGFYASMTGGGGLLHAGELSNFLGRQQYNMGLIDLLNELVDAPNPYTYHTRTHGSLTIKDVAFSLLGATATDLLPTAIPETAFGGGFMSRTLIVYEPDPVITGVALPPPSNPVQRQALVVGLQNFAQLQGEVVLTPGFKSYYETWYTVYRSRKYPTSRAADYHARVPQHLLRIAFLLAIAETAKLAPVDVRYVRQAESLLDHVGRNVEALWATIGTSLAGQLAMALLAVLDRAGGQATRSTVVRALIRKAGGPEISHAITTLAEGEAITVQEKPTTGRSALLLTLTDKGRKLLKGEDA